MSKGTATLQLQSGVCSTAYRPDIGNFSTFPGVPSHVFHSTSFQIPRVRSPETFSDLDFQKEFSLIAMNSITRCHRLLIPRRRTSVDGKRVLGFVARYRCRAPPLPGGQLKLGTAEVYPIWNPQKDSPSVSRIKAPLHVVSLDILFFSSPFFPSILFFPPPCYRY